jgi:drug/metabolite transporter (DMT)-like permease
MGRTDIRSYATAAQGTALVCASVVIWGMGGLFTRLLPFDLWTIIFWRGLFAAIFIGGYAWFRYGSALSVAILKAGFDGVVITVSIAAAIILFPAAFQHTSIANAFMILAALPFITVAIAWVWLRERLSTATLIASAVALSGVFVMVGPSAGGPRLGDGLAAAGTVAQAVATVAIRRNPNVAMLPMAWTAIVLSVVVALPLAEHIWDLTLRDYLVAVGFALGPMTLGMMLYVIGSALIPAALSALIGVAEAPIGALWAWVGIGEAPTVGTIVGGGIVLASVVGRLSIDLVRPKRLQAERDCGASRD